MLKMISFVAGTFLSLLASSQISTAQAPAPILDSGDVVVSGFAGTLAVDPPLPLLSDKSPIDFTFIDPDGISARIFDVARPGYVWDGKVFDASQKLALPAKTIGQVFGVAIDDEPAPNVYLAATSAFGLNIVARRADGTLERRKTGGPGTGWMPGQFGLDLLGGPGSIYRVDGTTGEVSLFAEVMLDGAANPGPALGNLAYDPVHRQLFVSDLYTGMVHRFAIADGAELGAPYDHGTIGRAADGLAAVPFNPSGRPNIANARFNSEDPTTWGYAPPPRRVWGLAVHEGRLFYSVGDGSDGETPQVWSVGLLNDGSFGSDARWELDVALDTGTYAVSDIVFSEQGAMILAQRAPVAGAYDYLALTEPGEPRVLRYWLENPNDPDTLSRWIEGPEEYAVGFAGSYRNTNGGVDLGYGYDEHGLIVDAACEYSLWTTGQQLRNDPALREWLQPGGPLVINGLQASPAGPVRGFNTPPDTSYFVDYDRRDDANEATGHLGGVRVLRTPCAPTAVAYPTEPPYIYYDTGWGSEVPELPPVVVIDSCPWPVGADGSCDLVDFDCPWGVAPDGSCGPVIPDCFTNSDRGRCGTVDIDLELEKTAGKPVFDEKSGQWTVAFTLTVTNSGDAFDPGGSIAIHDKVPPGMTFVGAFGTNWSCSSALPISSGRLNCSHAFGAGTLASGQTVDPLTIVATLEKAGKYENCAVVGVAPRSGLRETTRRNNKSCATAEIDIDVAVEKAGVFRPFVGDMPVPGTTNTIEYTLAVSNVGAGFVGNGGVVVTDVPPPGVVFTGVTAVPANWDCGPAGTFPIPPGGTPSGTLSCTYTGPGPAAPGDSLGTITVAATVGLQDKGPWENCASVGVAPAGFETKLDDNKDCVTLRAPEYDLALKKTFEKKDDTSGLYHLTVTNLKDEFPLPIKIDDPVPAGVTLTGVAGPWNCGIPPAFAGPGTLTCQYTGPLPIAAGAVLPGLDLSASLSHTPGGTYRNCAEVGLAVGSSLHETEYGNNTDCVDVEVEREIDLAIEKTGVVGIADVAPPPAPNPASIGYTLTVTNVGQAFPGNGVISVTDTPPPGVTFTGVTATNPLHWTCGIDPNTGGLDCDYIGPGPTAPGEVIGTITVTATARDKGPWENCASVAASAGIEAKPDDNTDCVTLKVPENDVSLGKKFEQGKEPGDGTYTLTVTNHGDDIVVPATTITITDPVPAGVTLTGVGSDWSCPPLPGSNVANPATLTCTYSGPSGTFASGTSLPDLVLNATLAPAKPGSPEIGIYRNCATVGLTAAGGLPPETNVDNNTDCAVTTTINHEGDCAVAGNCPTPEAVCKQDVLFIVDSSVSIGGGLPQVKSAIHAFLQAMQNAGGHAEIFSFNNGAIGTSNPSWSQVTTPSWPLVTGGNASTLANSITLGGTRTNWDDSLRHGLAVAPTAPLTGKPLVIFITDGEPTAYIDDTSSLEIDANATPVLASSQAVPWINAIRAGGSPLIAIGFGSVASQGYLDAAFTGSSSGPGDVDLTTSHVIRMDNVSGLTGVMRSLGSQMCGTLMLSKSVSPGGTTSYAIPIGGSSVSVNRTQTYGLTLTNNGQTAVNNIIVTDQVPAVLTNVASTSPGVTVAGNLVTWGPLTLGPGQQATASFTGVFAKTYTDPTYETYINYAQVAAADNYTATQLNDMNPVSGPVNEQDESAASFNINVYRETPPTCSGTSQPVWCYLTVSKTRANPGAEDTSCTSSPAGGPTNPCPFNINVSMSNIPTGSTVVVTDNLTLGGSAVSWPGTVSASLCNVGAPPSQISFQCVHNGLAGFGGQTTVSIPPGKSGELKNCVTVSVTNTTTTPPFNITATGCVTVQLSQPAGLVTPASDQKGEPPPTTRSTCQRPFVRTAKGTCECPAGTTPRGGECVKVDTCKRPMVLTQNGTCECPAGTVRRGGECAKVDTCKRPMVLTRNGTCECPAGTVRRGGECVKVDACKRPMVLNQRGACECPAGTVQRGGKCVKVDACKRPMVLNQRGACECPAGTVQRGGKCVKVDACKRPMVLNQRGACECPAGTVQRGGKCVKVDACKRPMVLTQKGTCECPAGTVQRGGKCLKPTDTPKPLACRAPAFPNKAGTRCLCPEGQQMKGNRCVPVRGAPVEKEKDRARTKDNKSGKEPGASTR